MFCPACGKALEEGKTFCKYCGAKLTPGPATTPSPPLGGPWTAPPPPPGGQWTPPPPSTGWSQVPQTPGTPGPPAPRSGGRTGLIVLIAIVALLLLLGAGVAVAFVLFAPAESEGERTQTSGVVVATTMSPATTVPSTDSGVDTTGYQQALAGLETALVHCDERMPALADQINAAAPSVPSSVSQELDSLYADVEKARSALGDLQPPPAYEQADQFIFEAADAMQNRIDQTSKGIDAMWNEGTVAAGAPYFDEGRRARDQFRTLFDQYLAAKP
jgi:hypothetical protein